MEPRLEYFEIYGSPEVWQTKYRKACYGSFFCIPKERFIFDAYGQDGRVTKAADLWDAIADMTLVGLGKSLFPNTYKNDFKGVSLQDSADRTLLLHFWPLVSTFFTPKTLKFEKSEKTREVIIRDEFQQPVIVVPDVINVKTYAGEFVNYLKMRPRPIVSQSGREYLPDAYISTPLEASLAFFIAPRLAHNRVITDDIIGARGARVFVYRRRI